MQDRETETERERERERDILRKGRGKDDIDRVCACMRRKWGWVGGGRVCVVGEEEMEKRGNLK